MRLARPGGERWRRGAATAAACWVLAGLAACSSGPSPGGSSSGGSSPGRSSPGPAGPGTIAPRGGAVLPAGAYAALGSGTLYLLLGDQNVSANLWQVQPADQRTRQLTFNPPQDGISNFSASPAGLVMGDAATGVDLAEIMRDGKPALLSGGIGDSPQINDAGQITDFVSSEQGVTHGPWSHDRLLLWTSATTSYRTIYQARPYNLATNAWNPDGSQILLTAGPSDDAFTRLLVADSAGRIVRRLAKLPGLGGSTYAWGRYGLAIGSFTAGPDEVLSSSGQVLDMLPGGWVPACWNPDGSALLVVSRSQRQIGIWRQAQPGRVQALGALPGGALQECSWISRPAAGTGPPQ